MDRVPKSTPAHTHHQPSSYTKLCAAYFRHAQPLQCSRGPTRCRGDILRLMSNMVMLTDDLQTYLMLPYS